MAWDAIGLDVNGWHGMVRGKVFLEDFLVNDMLLPTSGFDASYITFKTCYINSNPLF